MKELGIRISLILLIAIFIASGWYFLAPYFFNRVVEKPSPFVFPSQDKVGIIMMPGKTKAESVAARILAPAAHRNDGTLTAKAIVSAQKERWQVQATPTAPTPITTTQVISESVELEDATPEKNTSTMPMVLGQGHFVDADAFHKGSGLATLYMLMNGDYLLRLEDLVTSSGPDLHVLLSPNEAPTNHDSLGDYLDLGDLQSNIGDQNYALPADIDLTQYRSVVIYCVPYRIVFATATLEGP